MGGFNMQYNHYDFVGKLVSTRKRQSSSANTAIPELLTYDYDQVGRLKSTTYQIKNQTPILLCSYRYDELGRRVTEYHHYKSDSVNYNYNIRSWTTRIKSGTFEENLYYQDITGLPSGSTQCYNGNICYQTWTYGTVNKGYQFDYDELNRLAASYFYKGSSTQADSDFNEEFAYDIMGNVTALRRYKDGVLIDDLTLYYNGNQLRRVLDAAGSQNLYSVKEYNATTNASSGDSQTYDANGNLISDYDRNIVAIRYNVLNLPDTIQFKSGNQIINRYNAAGVKLKTVYYTLTYPVVIPLGATTKWTYRDGYVTLSGTSYVDNVEYSLRSNGLAYDNGGKVYNEVGYSSGDASSSYFYYRKDHLGNVREVVSSSLAVLQRTQYYPSGLPWSEGLNPSTQERKYNGKEFIEMDGLDTYDYGARGLQAATMRFTTMDPLAEKYYSISPYAYCAGNPVNFVDPKGMDVVYFDGNAKEIGRIKSDERFESYYRVDNGTDGAVNSEISKMKGSFMEAEMPGVIAGYEAPQYQQLDYQIAATTAIMNDKLESLTGLPSTDNHQFTENSQTPKLDVNLVKSMIMEESKMGTAKGGMGTAKTDPMQVNNNGDWSNDKTSVGLTKGQSMNAGTSINAGVGMLVLKGMKSDASGNYTTWRGDRNAVQKYNGGGNPSYVNDVFKYFNSVQSATRSNYVTK